MNTIDFYIKYPVLVLWIYTMSFYVFGAPTGDSGTVEKKLGGQYLISLGSTFNNPLLKLLGLTFVQTEKDLAKEKENFLELCKFHSCGEWTAWTDCPGIWKNQFSMINRTRTCGQNTTMCTYTSQKSFVTSESKVCEGEICPEDYNFTDGFCLKYVSEELSPTDAQSKCQSDSGHVVHINTKAKSDAVHAILSSHGYTGTIWINGHRKLVGSPWEFTYETATAFDNWYTGEPNSDSKPNICKVDELDPRKWRDRVCTNTYSFVCEIP